MDSFRHRTRGPMTRPALGRRSSRHSAAIALDSLVGEHRERSAPARRVAPPVRVNHRAACCRPGVPRARDSSETAGTIILRMAGNILK